ncbi:hypothetical protein ACIBEJ_00330 [Nonomuraea sp. NPDC050790]|uniref:hypothetical protein n=1 Tax=Nonomuraea sp. NPDC050790 TaxID=3364371 RepID=UPI0037B13AEF
MVSIARCGCASSCSCLITAGPGAAVSGNGSSQNPYVVSATGMLDCEAVQDCVGAGFVDGLQYDDDANQFRARISPAPGNNLSQGPNGLFVPTGAATVSVADSACIDLSGNGSGGSPITAAPILNAAAGNLITCTPTGLRAALALATCGLAGDGSAASPLAAKVGAWSYPCAVDTFAGNVYCDSNGTLRSEPRGRADFQQVTETTNFADVAVPAALDTLILTRNVLVTNPDTCREMFLLMEQELDVDFILPAGAGAAYGQDTDEVVYHRNTGSSTETDFHVQTTKVFRLANVAAGGSVNYAFNVTMGRGSAGATYNRVQTFVRAFKFIL